MALNFPLNPSDGDLHTFFDTTYVYVAARDVWERAGSDQIFSGGSTSADPYLTLSESGLTSTTLPAGAPPGSLAYATDQGGNLWFRNETEWRSVTLPALGSIDRPANSAVEILGEDPNATDGFYWIYVGATPTQVWCDMTNNGGGWMLAMKTLGDGVDFRYGSANWTNTTTFNATSDPTSFSGTIKTTVYTGKPFSSVRIAMGSISNGLVESTWNNPTSFATFMASGSTNSSQGRTAWLNMTSAGGASGAVASINSAYPNCNQIGTSKAYAYQYAKVGGTFNNEGDCNTCDASVGFGLQGISPYSNNFSCGANVANSVYYVTGWIFVR